MTCSSDPQNLNIDTTQQLNPSFILRTVFADLRFGKGSIRNVNILWRDIDMIEQMFLHKPMIRLQFIRLHRKILIEIKRDNVLERDAIFLVHPDQLVVNSNGCAAGCQTKNTPAFFGLAFANFLDNSLGNRNGSR